MELLRKFKLVFNAEKVEYDIDQVAFKLEGFMDNIFCNKKTMI